MYSGLLTNLWTFKAKFRAVRSKSKINMHHTKEIRLNSIDYWMSKDVRTIGIQ
jgi:hypothetical protein